MIIRLKNDYLRVLGFPNPGQSFGRGLSGPQATEVKMDPVVTYFDVKSASKSLVAFFGTTFCHPAAASKS